MTDGWAHQWAHNCISVTIGSGDTVFITHNVMMARDTSYMYSFQSKVEDGQVALRLLDSNILETVERLVIEGLADSTAGGAAWTRFYKIGELLKNPR